MVGMEVNRTIKILLSSQADEILNYVITDGDRSRKRKHIFKKWNLQIWPVIKGDYTGKGCGLGWLLDVKWFV